MEEPYSVTGSPKHPLSPQLSSRVEVDPARNVQDQVPERREGFQDSACSDLEEVGESDHEYPSVIVPEPKSRQPSSLERVYNERVMESSPDSMSEDLESDGEDDADYEPRHSAVANRYRATAGRRGIIRRMPSTSTTSGRVYKFKHVRPSTPGLVRLFPCPLAQYGCTSTFTSKKEWKRHVSTQHIKLGYWRCDMCSPTDSKNPVYNDFNRKDLFTQHLRRMHRKHPLTTSTIINVRSETEISDEAMQHHLDRCYLRLRESPIESTCLFCNQIFQGRGSWDERMEHVGGHMEKQHSTNKPIVPVEEWHEDLDLRDYLEREGMIEFDSGKWSIGDGRPLRDDLMGLRLDASEGSSLETSRTLSDHLYDTTAAGQPAVLSPHLPEDDTLSETGSSSSDVLSQMELTTTPHAELLHKYMVAFCIPFYNNLRRASGDVRSHQQDQEGNGSISSNISPSGHGGSATSTSNSTSCKRKRASEEANGDDQLGSNGRNTKRLDNSGEATTLPTRYACIFYKRNPARYKNHRSCPGPGWENVHRLKAHLYRCHALPVQCDRCGATYDNDILLKGHRRAPRGCEVRDFPVREGVTSEQEIQLRSRKRVKENETEEEKWYRAYGILFPYDDPTAYPTPYYEISTCPQPRMSTYHEFLRLEMPAQMQQQLALEIETDLSASLEGADERLFRHLPTIVHIVHRRIFRLFEESRRATQTSNEATHLDLPAHSNNSTSQDTPPVQLLDNAADRFLDNWFEMDETTFTADFSLDPFSTMFDNQ